VPPLHALIHSSLFPGDLGSVFDGGLNSFILDSGIKRGFCP
jgi:hypothetical protein